MAVAYQNIGAVDSAADLDSTIDAAVPTGTITSGDLLVIAVVTGKADLPSASGWTQTGTAGDDTVFLHKIADGTETGSVTVTVGTYSAASCAMMHFTGNASSGITDNTYTSSGGSTQLDFPSVTVSTSGAGLVFIGTSIYNSATATVSSCSRGSATSRVNSAIGTSNRGFYCYTEDNVSAGTISSEYFTMSESSSQWRSNVLLIPVSGGGGGGATIPAIINHRRIMGMV